MGSLRFRIRCGVSETPSGNEMQELTVNKVRWKIGNENEIEDAQSLALIELIVIGSAKSRISKNGNVLSAQEPFVSQIEGGKMKEIFRVISKNAPKSEKGRQVIDRNGFFEERDRRLEAWNKMKNVI